MGWYRTPGSTLKGTIEELTEGWTSEKEDRVVTLVCIAKCFRGARTHKGILWAVFEHTVIIKATGETTSKRFISCHLLEYWPGDRRGWAYKPLDEEMEPYYYNCPERYLKMVPVANQEWRDEVARYHNHRRACLAEKRAQLV